LDRSPALGGGARSVTKIARGVFGDAELEYSKLSEAEKAIVFAVERHEWLWSNHHQLRTVKAVDCLQSFSARSGSRPVCSRCDALLHNNDFQSALNHKTSGDPSKAKHTPSRFRQDGLLEISLMQHQLAGLLQADGSKESLWTRFIKGALRGDFTDDKVFLGLLEAVLVVKDKDRRGVGMQNMKWNPDYD
ncbi:hypothetical protein EXIGLDRAFT_573080, partial [Exidia glandulosa HHB12029]